MREPTTMPAPMVEADRPDEPMIFTFSAIHAKATPRPVPLPS